jgi:hypothetical protein
LADGHVDVIDVRALFPINLDGNEMFVEESRHILIFKRLVLHHMTPVACGIPHREKNRLILAAGLLESLLSPRMPVHWIMRVLQEIRALFVNESIGHHSAPNMVLVT